MPKKLGRLRAIPWLMVFETARAAHAHAMDKLTPRDRKRVADILRASHGNPMRVTPAQRGELRKIALKLAQR